MHGRFFLPLFLFAPEDGGGGGAPGAAGDGGGEAAPAWDAGLDEPTRTLVAERGWQGPADAVKAFGELEQRAAGMVALPGEAAKPEDWAAFYDKLGRPESAEQYDLGDFKPPEGLPWSGEVQAAMLGKMHEAGLNSAQVKGLLGAYAGVQQAQLQALETAAEQAAAADRAALEKEWGGAWKARMDEANLAVRAVFGEDLDAAKDLRLADGRFLLDDARLARVFAKIAPLVNEAGDLPGAKAGASQAGDAEAARLARMYPSMMKKD